MKPNFSPSSPSFPCRTHLQVLAGALFLGAISFSPAQSAHAATGTLLRVALSTQGGPIVLQSRAPLTLSDVTQPGRKWVISSNARVVCTSNSDGKSVSVQSGARRENWRVLRARPSSELIRVGSAPAGNRSGAHLFRGWMEIKLQSTAYEARLQRGPLQVVNVVAVDEYLRGALPVGMESGAPFEALKAQAICARSKTLDRLADKRFARFGYDLVDFDGAQIYRGVERENLAASLAVRQTSGLVLTNSNRIIDAMVSPNSGGMTADDSEIFPSSNEPYLRALRDFSPVKHPQTARVVRVRMSEADWLAFCSNALPSYARPTTAQVRDLAARRRRSAQTRALYGNEDWPEFYRWTRVISPYALAKALMERPDFAPANARAAALTYVAQMRVVSRGPGGHIKQLQLVCATRGAGNRVFNFQGDVAIRKAFTSLPAMDTLPSSRFVVVPRRDTRGVLNGFILKGAGWGTGVGMCQRGAQTHARDGWSARQIVKFYFPNTQLIKAY